MGVFLHRLAVSFLIGYKRRILYQHGKRGVPVKQLLKPFVHGVIIPVFPAFAYSAAFCVFPAARAITAEKDDCRTPGA
jgi:hypothetical protein